MEHDDPVDERGGVEGELISPQLTREDLKTMTPQEIYEATAQGRVRDLLAGKEL